MASSILAAPEGPVPGTFFTPAATCGWTKTRSTRNSPEHQAGQPAEGWPNSRLGERAGASALRPAAVSASDTQ